jgi:hypothetical protein
MSSDMTTQADNLNLQELLRKKLSDQIKSGFVNLIPDEAFEKMIGAAMDDFMHGPRNKRFKMTTEWLEEDDPRNTLGRTGNVQVETPFVDPTYDVMRDPNTLPGMIMAELHALAKADLIKTISQDPIFQQKYVDGQYVTDALKGIVTDNPGPFMEALVGGIISRSMMNFMNEMRNSSGRLYG